MDKLTSMIEEADPFSSWWPFIVAIGVGLAMVIRTIMGGQRCPNANQIKDQTVIVTGGSNGIGLEIAKGLAARGAHVIIACKDLVNAEKMMKIVKRELKCNTTTSEFTIEIKYLDLGSFDSVREFASDILKEHNNIDILINNAGTLFNPDGKTIDGFEVHLQINYLSHFLLTHLLLDKLKKSTNGRIINVSAHGHAAAKMDYDDPLNIGTWSVKFHARDAFAHSKLSVILGNKWLAHILKDTNVTVNTYTPGLVRGTNHLRNSPLMSAISIRLITYPWMWLFMKNPFEGAQTAIHLATDPKLRNVTGEYFNDCEISNPSQFGRDKQLAKKLYDQTINALKLPKDNYIDGDE